MAYGSVVDPVGGTVITVAYAVTNILDPIRWLRLMTGNADPPGSSYVVVSDSTTGTTWRKIPTDAIADSAVTTVKVADGAITAPKFVAGAVVAHLGYTPYSAAGGIVSGDMIVYRPGSPTTGFIGLGGPSLSHTLGFDGTNLVADGGKIWTELNDGPSSGLAAQTADTATLAAAATNALALGGVTASSYARITKGTYAGGGNADRTITTGFVCKHVSLMGVFGSTTVLFLEIRSTTVSENIASSFRFSGSPAASILQMSTATKLDASDGFHVNGTGLDGTDNAGATYYWTAWG